MQGSTKVGLADRTSRNKYILITLVVLLLAGTLIYLTMNRDSEQEEVPLQQEFGEISNVIVQLYLHMPGGDYIVGRKNKNYPQLVQAAQKSITSISGPLAQKQYSEEEIKKLESQGISLSIWLAKPAKVSTAIKGAKGAVLDKYQNRVITADRFLFTLSGKEQGVFSRNADTGKWEAWKVSGNNYRKLIELIRKGGI